MRDLSRRPVFKRMRAPFSTNTALLASLKVALRDKSRPAVDVDGASIDFAADLLRLGDIFAPD